ncbi:MAG: hypothetical protein ACLRNQ_29320 [Flavonifractor plautii]
MQYPLSWCFRIGLVLVCAVLAFLGWEGSSRVSYTLRRLSVGHRALTLLWASYGFFCLLFFWAAHLGTLLALCAAALPRLAPEFSGPQALFLACYRDPYLHSLLTLDDWPLWARNLSMCAALGTSAACFSFQRRMGRRAFAVLPLAALSALCFPLPMGSFEFGGPAEFLRPYLYDGIFYSADGLPSVLGPVLLFVSLCALAASLCQILRRDPYEE